MKKRFILALLLSIVLTIQVFLVDDSIIKIVAQSRTGYLDYVFLSVAFASNIFIIFFFLTSLFLWTENKRRWIVPLWLSGFYAVVVSYLLKISIMRLRPFQEGLVPALQVGLHFIKDNFMTWNSSFPSFQAMFVFSALPVLSKEFKRLKYVWFIFACLVAFSRVYFGLHYLSDVLAGAIIGYLIGLGIVIVEEKKEWGVRVMKVLRVGKK